MGRVRLLFVLCLVGSLMKPLHAQSIAERYLFQAANQERAARGLGQLTWNPQLAVAAQRHAEEMAARQTISHQFNGEADLSTRAASSGTHFSLIAENVAEAPTPLRIHDAWMHSEGHRANLLDPVADSVGISVLQRNGQLYAVQDFARITRQLTFNQQEDAIRRLVAQSGSVEFVGNPADARATCLLSTGYAGPRQPGFVMRFTSNDLTAIPKQLATRIASGGYQQAAVGACETQAKNNFSTYSFAVVLYR